jgi:hypothetical protein
MSLLEFTLWFVLPLAGFVAAGYALCYLRFRRRMIERESLQDAAIRRAFELGRQAWRNEVGIGKN